MHGCNGNGDGNNHDKNNNNANSQDDDGNDNSVDGSGNCDGGSIGNSNGGATDNNQLKLLKQRRCSKPLPKPRDAAQRQGELKSG